MKRYYFLLAIVIFAVGFHFFLLQMPIPIIQNWDINGSLLLFLFIGLFIHARRARDEILAFFSAFLLLILWQNYTEANIGIWPTHWGVFIIYVGVALALARKQKIAIIPIAIGLGVLFIPAIASLFFFVPKIIHYIEMYYSILFLLLAGYYFYQQK